MKAMRLFEPKKAEVGPLQLCELPVPEPGVGQVRLQVQACGVCHTDLHIAEGELQPPSLALTPGHQVVGVVEALGEGSEQSYKIGDRLGVPWLHDACGECEFCLRGQENLCPQARFTGFHVDGGFAEFILAQAGWVLPLPAGISSEQAAPLLCAGLIGYRSLKQAGLQPGERLGLVGFGASAHLAIQVARGWDCEVYVYTRSENHRRHAESLGAAWTGSIEDPAPNLLDRAVIFAPAGELVPKTLAKLRPGGSLAINAVYMSDIPSFPYQAIYGERTVRSVSNATRQDGLDFMRIAEEYKLVSTVSRYSLEQANLALQDLKASRIDGEAVLVL